MTYCGRKGNSEKINILEPGNCYQDNKKGQQLPELRENQRLFGWKKPQRNVEKGFKSKIKNLDE